MSACLGAAALLLAGAPAGAQDQAPAPAPGAPATSGAPAAPMPPLAGEQSASPQPSPAQPQPAPAPPNQGQQAAAPAQVSPSNRSTVELVVTLIRTTLVAVHDANVTGNYSVLRDLSAPGFRDKNSAADLAAIFAPLRQLKVDLSAVVLLDPQLSLATLTKQGMLHLAGRLATRPVPVTFELLFQPVDGTWRLFGISIAPIQNQSALPAPPAPAATNAAAPAGRAAAPRHRTQTRKKPQKRGSPASAGAAADRPAAGPPDAE